ncbi:hypothetical protein [Duganella sp. BJB476]|uniref:hypothetical protein n=1 Tax=Duganella sp. BJB476 TaxID=1871176 RepID=UPI0013146E57|nr:hypothetical protein [Duganella sp. BJB476]
MDDATKNAIWWAILRDINRLNEEIANLRAADCNAHADKLDLIVQRLVVAQPQFVGGGF